MSRRGKVTRKTAESEITVEINLDGSGKSEISTGVPFYDHMLTALAKPVSYTHLTLPTKA